MDDIDLQKTLEIATGIARDAGALLLDGFGRTKRIEKKSSALDWVTQYDKMSETLIAGRLREAFPDHDLVGEEGTNTDGHKPYRWYIDPLDGTTNYAHGFPVFCVTMGLYRGDDPVLGLVYDPLRQECFTAIAGQGAYLDRPQGGRRLQVSRQTELVAALLATGFPYDVQTNPDNNINYLGAFVPRAHGIRRAGSAALDAAYVAAGRLDGYWELRVHSWDLSAAVLIVQEAGGRVTTLEGRPFRLQPQFDVLISNGHLHDKMQAVIDHVNGNSPAAA